MSIHKSKVKAPQPDKSTILKHLWALFPADFVHQYPDAMIEIAYGAPGSLDRAQLFPAFNLDEAAAFALSENRKGRNLYVGRNFQEGRHGAIRANEGYRLSRGPLGMGRL